MASQVTEQAASTGVVAMNGPGRRLMPEWVRRMISAQSCTWNHTREHRRHFHIADNRNHGWLPNMHSYIELPLRSVPGCGFGGCQLRKQVGQEQWEPKSF